LTRIARRSRLIGGHNIQGSTVPNLDEDGARAFIADNAENENEAARAII